MSNITSLYQCQLYKICWQYKDVATSLMTLKILTFYEPNRLLSIDSPRKYIDWNNSANVLHKSQAQKKTSSILSYYITSIIMNDNVNYNHRCHMVVNFKIDVLYNSLRNKIKYTQKYQYIIQKNHTEKTYFDLNWTWLNLIEFDWTWLNTSTTFSKITRK